MLFRTVQLTKKSSNVEEEDQDTQTAYLQNVKGKLEIILQEMLREKRQLQQHFQQEKCSLLQEIDSKNAKIERLQKTLHNLQQQNQQIRFQYDQRVSLMNILKRQNWLISKEYSEQKREVRETVEYLVRENEKLKEQLMQRFHNNYNLYAATTPRRVIHSPRNPTKPSLSPNFYSMTDLRRQSQPEIVSNKAKNNHIRQVRQQIQPECSQNDISLQRESDIDHNISSSSISNLLKLQQKAEFAQSRITQIKGAKSKYKGGGLQKMSTKTHLSRQRTSGGREDP